MLVCILIGTSLSVKSQILQRDSLALVSFYDDTFGSTWINNSGWLQAPVGQWYGVGLDPGGQVITLKLPDNNLQGVISDDIKDLVSLHVLDISGNHIEGLPNVINEMEVSVVDAGNNNLSALPDYSNIDRTFTLYVNDNYLDFSDLEINALLPGLIYYPQRLSATSETREVTLGSNQLLDALIPGNFNRYQWFFQDQPLEGATNSRLDLINILLHQLGRYHCVVQNDLLPRLEVTSSTINLLAFTTISGAITNEQDKALNSALRVYRITGDTLELTQAPSLQEGQWSDHPIAMGNYLIKAAPNDPRYPPRYLGNGSLFWEQAEGFTIDGSQGDLYYEISALDELTGSHELNGNLVSQTALPENIDLYLFLLQAGEENLVAHTKPGSELNFGFTALPQGTYKVMVDLPGLPLTSTAEIPIPEQSDPLQIVLENAENLLPAPSIARQWNEL
ncbi:MAG: hypothetical protein OER04_11575, partial [Cyclobacteriaceae bacterium]|nr:hypothetical protein [Cyclobacteriaceae bacterium]